jgi:exonuclease SbcD
MSAGFAFSGGKTMPQPINLLHLADIHIGMENYGRLDSKSGLNSRVVDFLRRLSQVIDIALEREVDVCIFAGDAYKNQRPNPTFQREFCRRIKRLADAGVPIVLLVGNHDMATADRAASSLDIFGVFDLPGVIVADREEVHQIVCRRGQPLQVATVPYPHRGRLLTHDQFRNMTLDDLDLALARILGNNIVELVEAAKEQPDIPAVLAAHLSVSGAKQGSEQSVMIGRDVVVLRSLLADPVWDYVALGHIHKHQELNEGQHPPIVYPGSLERIDFGEEGERKGFVMVELEKGRASWEFIPVDARRFVTIRMDVTQTDEPMTTILDELEQHRVEGAVVRLIIKATETQELLIDDKPIRQALGSASYIASITRDIDRTQLRRLGDIATEELTPQQALELYLESKETPAERKEELLRYAEAIFREE